MRPTGKWKDMLLAILTWLGRQIRRIILILLALVTVYLAVTLVLLITKSVQANGIFSALIFAGFFALIATFFLSRYGAKQLTKIKLDYFLQIGKDIVPKPLKKEVLCNGMLVLSPFNLIWGAVALLIPLGGGTAWLATSLPAFVFSWFQMIFIKEKCKDLDVSLFPLICIEILLYLLSILFGALLLIRAEGF